MRKKQYAFLIAIAVLALTLLPTSCTCEGPIASDPADEESNPTDTSGQFEGYWNPDGIGQPDNSIAFVYMNEIYVKALDSWEKLRVVAGTDPVWSPDGSNIAFVQRKETNDPGSYSNYKNSLYIMDTTGNEPIMVTNDYNHNGIRTALSWSPDGSTMVFETGPNGITELYSINSDGTGKTRLTNNPGGDESPAFSPDGTKIAFSSSYIDGDGIYVMDADGSNQTRLMTEEEGYNLTDLTWSPDGSKIAYTHALNVMSGIHIIDSDGTNRIQLTNNESMENSLSWSPDGAKILFATTTFEPSFARQIWTVNADGTELTNLTLASTRASSPSWTQDGNKIIYTDSMDTYIMNADGTNRTWLASGHSTVSLP
ncbi:MAG: hypothetical protein HN929_12100 [Chloroflexi bacterium]|mgnify:CR=1 FL=1|jgi:Tol biopolymer transport system component|nr:hypothetical protein [Chloroflexota bacterium]MBT7082182.1 hypothetical protein [Chloroflexota bacterium]MBT7288977.1 hypothetical protein [Chloroflexota bacterium]